jgi:hypothetical protein
MRRRVFVVRTDVTEQRGGATMRVKGIRELGTKLAATIN